MTTSNLYARRAAAFRNEMRTSCAALMGLVQGLLADHELQDQEVRFLEQWLKGCEAVVGVWPGTAIYDQVRSVLADGVITVEERQHLTFTLLALVGGMLDELAGSQHVNRLALDEVPQVDIPDRVFCFSGDFVFGPRTACEKAVVERGGQVTGLVTKKLHYLVVGGLGSPEWKHGTFGTKIEKAIEYRDSGVPLRIVHEDAWAYSVRAS